MKQKECAGLSTFLSWSRLAEKLRDAGIIKPSEDVKGFKPDENGLTVSLDYKKDQK